MPGESKLTRRQLALLLWGAMLSPLVRRLPGAAGRGAWLAALLALPPALLLGSLLGRTLSRRRPGEGLGELFLRAAGPVPGRIAAGLFGLWFLFYGGFVLRAGADRFVSAVYTDSPVWPFLAVTGLLGLLVGVGRLKTLARVAEAAAPPLAGLFALVIALSPETVEPAELWPLSADDVHQALRAVPGLFNALSAGAYLAFLAGEAEGGPLGACFSLPLGALALLAAALSAVIVGSFGAGLAGRMNYPLFVLLRNLRVFHLLDRAEALLAAAWLVTDLLLLGALGHLASRALTLALRGPGTPPGRTAAVVCGAAVILLGLVCAPTTFALRALGETVIPPVHAALLFGLGGLCLLSGKLRKTL